jgi:quinoprotein dehydrogenase-associated probable ABC transporter substrate-binding protein
MSSDSKHDASFRGGLATLAAVVAALVAMNFHMLARSADAQGEADPHVSQDGGHALRVCADPNNLPFSNDRGEGFENELAQLLARELHREVSYTWWPQRRGFIRHTLRAHQCDLVMSMPTHSEMVLTTRPYYRSTYVFVTRKRDGLRLRSLDDPQLKQLRIGLHAIGDDYSNVPPAQALAERGITKNVHGYSIYGDYSKPDPPRDLIDAVAHGDIDVAIAWGPLGGYFARHADVPLEVSPVADTHDRRLPMAFDIALGVRRDDRQLASQLEAALMRRHDEIVTLLKRYGVPFMEPAALASAGD